MARRKRKSGTGQRLRMWFRRILYDVLAFVVEKNAFNGRFDDLMFFDRVLTAEEIQAQFDRFSP